MVSFLSTRRLQIAPIQSVLLANSAKLTANDMRKRQGGSQQPAPPRVTGSAPISSRLGVLAVSQLLKVCQRQDVTGTVTCGSITVLGSFTQPSAKLNRQRSYLLPRMSLKLPLLNMALRYGVFAPTTAFTPLLLSS